MSAWLQLLVLVAGPRGRVPSARRLHGVGVTVRALTPRRAGDLSGCRRRSDVEQRWSAYAMSVLVFSFCSRPAALRLPARTGRPAAVARLRRRPPGPGVQHRRVVHHEHELAVLLRGVDDGPSRPDGGLAGPELRVGGRRGWPSRSRWSGGSPGARPDDRQLLVGPGAVDGPDPAADRVRVRARSSSRRVWSRTSTASATVRPSGGTQAIPGGPVASQEAIKELGNNGGGFYNANSAHPFENPSPLTNFLADVPDARDPVRVDRHVRQDGRKTADRDTCWPP